MAYGKSLELAKIKVVSKIVSWKPNPRRRARKERARLLRAN